MPYPVRIICLAALLLAGTLHASRLELQPTRPAPQPRRIHPVERLMSGANTRAAATGQRDMTDTRLLVMLVEFQPDENAETTGTGLFLRQEDATDYPISLAAPPHDRAYYELQCEAMQYYWLAGSMGYFNLDYEVWPQQGYYQLPHDMAYYNPAGANSVLMVERFEEYFTDVYTAADADPGLTFSDFDHYMVIHAGSDWQHDVNGDTPSDMPSFFITVGDGKEVTVDDDATVINHLSNVPETIVQDVRYEEDGDLTYVNGYGVINAVMAHEFGHSLGLPDLYSTTNMRPAVGYWDIMDSGGQTLLGLPVDSNGDGNADQVYNIEGAIASLPGAWSRQFLWGDAMRADGLLRDITSFDLAEPVYVVAAGAQVGSLGGNRAQVIRIPLSDTEYVLLENRQTDHDDDGGTTLVTDGDQQRVVMYPTGNNNDIADEYDYALPGWPGIDGRYHGGGIVAWRVNNTVLYEDGSYDFHGDFVSNFAANTINTDYYNRGVSIIEADGLPDIGNIHSMFWQGTVYEPFYPLLATIDADGYFAGWSIESFAPAFTPATKPPLATSDGQPSIFALYDIDSEYYHRPFHVPPLELSFRCQVQAFEGNLALPLLSVSDSARVAWNPEPAFLGGNALSELAVFDGQSMTTFSHLYDGSSETWDSPLGQQTIGLHTAHPVSVGNFRTDVPGGEYLLACGNELGIVRSPNLAATHSFGSPGVSSPMIYEDETGATVTAYPAADSLFVNFGEAWEAWAIPAARLCSDGRYLYAFSQGRLWLVLHGVTLSELPYVTLPFTTTPYEPVAFLATDTNVDQSSGVYVLNPAGDIWRVPYGAGTAEEIFRLSAYTSAAPTQLALGPIEHNGPTMLHFAAGSRVFALTTKGRLASGYPLTVEGYTLAPGSFPRVIEYDKQPCTLLQTDLGGWIAVSSEGMQPALGMSWQQGAQNDLYFWEGESARLYHLGMVKETGGVRPVLSWLGEQYVSPIAWSGYRNGGSGGLRGRSVGDEPVTPTVSAVAFPNPSSTGEVRIRVEGAASAINVKIYDIAGNLVYEKGRIDPDEPVRWNTSRVSSGVYFAVVSTTSSMGGTVQQTLKIGIIK